MKEEREMQPSFTTYLNDIVYKIEFLIVLMYAFSQNTSIFLEFSSVSISLLSLFLHFTAGIMYSSQRPVTLTNKGSYMSTTIAVDSIGQNRLVNLTMGNP